MSVERADLVDIEAVLASVPSNIPRHLKRPPIEISSQESKVLTSLSWTNNVEADDEQMKRLADHTVFFMVDPEAKDDVVVFGSRSQAWVRASSSSHAESLAKRAAEVIRGSYKKNSVSAPRSSAYDVTVSCLSSDFSACSHWCPLCVIENDLSDVLRVVRRHLNVTISSQVRYSVPRHQLHPSHWSEAAVSPSPWHRPLHLVLYKENSTDFSHPFFFPGEAGVVFSWNPSVWREQLMLLLGFSDVASAFYEDPNLKFPNRQMPLILLADDFGQQNRVSIWQQNVWEDAFLDGVEQSARETLLSLPKLLASLPSMPLTSETASRLERAAKNVASSPMMAWETAESVYYDKDSLPLLYFPADHALAVYVPVFFPPIFAVLTGLWATLKVMREKRNRNKKQD